MIISIIGTGYVGLVAGTCLSDMGNEVICIDIDKRKINALRKGRLPIYEPGLKDILDYNVSENRLNFSTDLRKGIRSADVIIIAVGTPMGKDHRADVSFVTNVARQIGANMNGYKLVVCKSTVPVGTNSLVAKTISNAQPTPIEFDVASNPEFLREGNAVKDFMNPDRIIVGVDSKRAESLMLQIYKGIARTGKPIIFTDIRSAEMIKYASNALLATKISFINEIARLCEKVGADVKEVARGVGLDERIGPRFLQAGVGYGGSCFPKDVQALVQLGKQKRSSLQILQAVERVNKEQRMLLLKKIRSVYPKVRGKKIAVWGLAFKPKTDDMREAPSITIIKDLQKAGAQINAFDPVAVQSAKQIFHGVAYKNTPYATVKGVDALIIVTEWHVFRQLDLQKIRKLMRAPVIIDGRNIYEPADMKQLGFTYLCIGRESIT